MNAIWLEATARLGQEVLYCPPEEEGMNLGWESVSASERNRVTEKVEWENGWEM